MADVLESLARFNVFNGNPCHTITQVNFKEGAEYANRKVYMIKNSTLKMVTTYRYLVDSVTGDDIVVIDCE